MILGCRGVPARHGGFETFAEDLALYLVERGHRVTVYCQATKGQPFSEDNWRGVDRVHIPAGTGPLATLDFDWRAIRHSSRRKGVVLTLGYNSAVFNLRYKLRGVPCIMNMDGIEWKRPKWSPSQRAWLWVNELFGAIVSDHLVADHPEISRHLQRHTPARKITTIPYGADAVYSTPSDTLKAYKLKPGGYYLVIARPEPENSVLEIVAAYSRKPRSFSLAILGNYRPESNKYHERVMSASGPGVNFLGAIYDKSVVHALRFHARAYIHGHTVGGTNPSLVEALAAGSPIIAHDNSFNRWVAGQDAEYFGDTEGIARIFDSLERNPDLLGDMSCGSRKRHQEHFTQEKVLGAYEHLLLKVAGQPMESPSYVPEMSSEL